MESEGGAGRGMGNGEIAVCQERSGRVRLEVRLAGDTVWLSLAQMAVLFGRDKSFISRHLRRTFDAGELRRGAVVAENATVRREGNREVTRQVEYYNLDAILSVGYRVNSKPQRDTTGREGQATCPRLWRTAVAAASRRDSLRLGWT